MKTKLNLQRFAVDPKTIMEADLKKVRDVDFTLQFTAGIQSLMTMLGITRKLEKKPGEALKVYKVTGTLEDGEVAEGEIIPLSKYETSYEPIGEASLKKWRKQTTAEAISGKGYNQAVNDTTTRMLRDIQQGIRSDLFGALELGTTTATGTGLQELIADIWGKLQVVYEDMSVPVIHFVNPVDIATYLKTAPLTLQTAFGMRYIEDFLGMGTVIVLPGIPEGKVYATATENIVLYYISVTSADMGQAFSLTTDETGLIGVHTGPIYDNATLETVAMSGVGLFAEFPAGIVKGTLAAKP